MKKLLVLISGTVFLTAFVSGYAQTATQDNTHESAATAAFMKKAEDACNIKPSQAYKLGKQDGKAGVLTHAHALTLCANEAIFPAYNKGLKDGKKERAKAAASANKAKTLCDITPSQAYKLGEQDVKVGGLLRHAHGIELCGNEKLSQSYQDGVQAGNPGE